MSAIEAASVGVRTMADGTLRVTVDIEPSNAQAAFALFGSPGTPIALAALKVGHASIIEPEIKPDNPKGGELAKLAGMWCEKPDFQQWARDTYSSAHTVKSSHLAADWMRGLCDIKSRAELDSDQASAEIFHRMIRGPYLKHQMARGFA